MVRMKVFEATDPGQVAAFRNMRREWKNHLLQGRFCAEGEQVIVRLLQSPVKVFSLLITPAYLERWRGLIETKDDSEPDVWIAEKKWMEESTAQKVNQGCLAIGKVPHPPSLQNLASSGQSSCFIALDGIDHAVNVGSILRNCAAFGVTAVLVDDRSVSPYSWRSIRTSLGSIFHVPVSSESSLTEQLKILQNQNIELIAVDPKGSRSVPDFDFTKNYCFIFGSEHAGISRDVLNLTAARLRIHHSLKVDSLNVAAASAIILHRSNEARSSLR
jgi:tRNA G18 (ribose-2'-O)-methylase SpoU